MSTNSQRISNAAQAANAVLTLINSKPQSPTKDELAAMIAKAVPTLMLSS